MTLPSWDVTLSSGSAVGLASLWEPGPVALVFLRHFG
jgi:hypothetical protein